MDLLDTITILATEIQQYDEDCRKSIEAGVQPPHNPVAEATRTAVQILSPLSLPPIGSKVVREAKEFLGPADQVVLVNMPGRMPHRNMLKKVLKEFDKWLSATPAMVRHSANLELAACAQLAKQFGYEDMYEAIEARLPEGARFAISESVPTGEPSQNDEGGLPSVPRGTQEIDGQAIPSNSEGSGDPV